MNGYLDLPQSSCCSQTHHVFDREFRCPIREFFYCFYLLGLPPTLSRLSRLTAKGPKSTVTRRLKPMPPRRLFQFIALLWVPLKSSTGRHQIRITCSPLKGLVRLYIKERRRARGSLGSPSEHPSPCPSPSPLTDPQPLALGVGPFHGTPVSQSQLFPNTLRLETSMFRQSAIQTIQSKHSSSVSRERRVPSARPGRRFDS